MSKSCDLQLGQFNVIQGQRSWCQSIAHKWFPIRLPLTPSSYLSLFTKYLTCNFNDLELGGFKVDPRSEVMVPIESPLVVSYLTSIGSNVVSRTVFEIFDAKIMWPRSRTVQGHPRSMVMVPIESPWAVSYLTSQHLISYYFRDIWHQRYFSIGAMVGINSTSVLSLTLMLVLL